MKLPRYFHPLLPLVLLLLLLPVLTVSYPHARAIFNFGDSNSDTGGLSATFGPWPLPYGETFFGKPAGRKSDGRLIIDFLAGSLGLPSYLSAYLDSLGTNYSHGANFASVSSTIVDQNVTYSQRGISPFYLGVQLMQFLQFKSRSQIVRKRGGIFKDLMPKEHYFCDALYTIDIGQNDIAAAIFANKSAEEFIPDTMKELSRVVKTLHKNGARNFWIHNQGPLGCLPYVLIYEKRMGSRLDFSGCSSRANNLVGEFNRKLKKTVVQLMREHPLASFTYVDIFSIKFSLINGAPWNGFEHPLTTCCGYGCGEYNFNYSVLCGDTGIVNGMEVLLGKSCEDPSKRINWDGPHYTEAANRWVFSQIATGRHSDPPTPLNMAYCREVEYDRDNKPSSSSR